MLRHYIRMLLIKVGIIKTETDGISLINETLEGFVSIVENLQLGIEKTADEADDVASQITRLREAQKSLLAHNDKAWKAKEDLLKLMGE